MDQATGKARSWGFLIGINKYPPTLGVELRGCVNDAELWAKILVENFAFHREDLVLLCDQEATRERILCEFDALVDRVQQNDIVVVFYAGHGARMRDREGDKLSGYDETIVPIDSGRFPHENRDITDDELRLRVTRLAAKSCYTTLIFDCCHSGTLHRDVFGEAERSAPTDDRSITELPPSPISIAERGLRYSNTGGWLQSGDHLIVLAACRNDEKAREIRATDECSEVRHGALTYFLSRQVLQARSGATYRDVFEPASALVTAYSRAQHPCCEGAKDRVLFGVHERMPPRYVPISDAGRGRATLAAGAAHGIVKGSRWYVYPATAQDTVTDQPSLAVLEVQSVGALTAQAQIQPAEAALAPAMRAIEFERPALRAAVAVQADADASLGMKLRTLLDDSLWVCSAADSAEAWAQATLRKGPGQLPHWSVVSRDGRPLMRAIHGADLVTLRANLEAHLRFQQTLSLRNPQSRLTGMLEMHLLRQNEGNWRRAADDKGQCVYQVGERLAIELKNRHRNPLYICVLAFGIDKSVQQIYPPFDGPAEELESGKSKYIGLRDDDQLTLFFPDDISLVPEPDGSRPMEGTDFIKVILTSSSVDFSWLWSKGLRGTPRATNALERLLERALTGRGHRSIAVNYNAREDWTEESRVVVLRRRKDG